MICFQNSLINKSNFFFKKKKTDSLFLNSYIRPNLKNNKNIQLALASEFYYETISEKKLNKQKINLPINDIILGLQSNETEKDFLKFCFLNRENISYILLHQITALKLKKDEDDKETLRGNKIIGLRKKILENVQLIDQPISQSLIVSEKIIKEILTKDYSDRDLKRLIKNNKLNVSSLWIVLTAAITAWEKKIEFENEEISSKTLEKIKKIKKVVFSDKEINCLLAKEFIFIDFFDSNDSNSTNFETGYIDGLKLFICILEKLPKSSYGILLGKVSDIYKKILIVNFGIKKQLFGENVAQFFPKKITTDSRLVNIKDNSIKY
jgi:hypothetical protein